MKHYLSFLKILPLLIYQLPANCLLFAKLQSNLSNNQTIQYNRMTKNDNLLHPIYEANITNYATVLANRQLPIAS